MSNEQQQDPNFALNGERYIHPRTGRTHIKVPAGGVGGGVTSYADVPATEEQHVAYLRLQAEQKKAESEDLHKRHEHDNKKLEKHKAREEEERKARERDQPQDEDDDRYEANPIDDLTYGRPPVNPEPVMPGPHNPADGRDVEADTEDTLSPIKPREGHADHSRE